MAAAGQNPLLATVPSEVAAQYYSAVCTMQNFIKCFIVAILSALDVSVAADQQSWPRRRGQAGCGRWEGKGSVCYENVSIRRCHTHGETTGAIEVACAERSLCHVPQSQ